jgi:AraC-like DNA-binding protein
VLLWQARGASDISLGGAPRQQLIEGHALWIPAGLRHALHVRADSVILPMHMRRRPSSGTLTAPTWITVDGELRTLLLAVLQTQNSVIRPDVDLERRVLRMLEGRAVPPTGLPMPRSETAHAIAEFLRDHPGDASALTELAEAHHVSARTVERAFLADTGMTLREWRSRRRMEVAGALLRRTDSLGAVAGRVGYESASAFRRAFRAHFGMSPSEYKRSFALPG